ncbi:MAG: glycosyltransferase family protein [Pseudohaliea sp.]
MNELEFNCWLLDAVPGASVYTPFVPLQLGDASGNRLHGTGAYSLRRPFTAVLRQFQVVLRLRRVMANGDLLYYRHSRLAFGVMLLLRLRPGIRLVLTRSHPRGSDLAVQEKPAARALAALIEALDFRLRRRLARRAIWVDCVTPAQAKQLESETGRHVEVVMNGVNTRTFSPIEPEQRERLRAELGIPKEALVIGYCGGYPLQRGAMEVSLLSGEWPGAFGVVIGALKEADRVRLAHGRVRLLGQVPYARVAPLVATFDIALAFDNPARIGRVGNSNQKVRQALATGAYVVTQDSDLPLDGNPELGVNVPDRDLRTLLEACRNAPLTPQARNARVEFARAHLDTASIYRRRHEAVSGGL